MSKNALAACKADLYTDRSELMRRYPLEIVEKVVRVRDMHQAMMADPTQSNRETVRVIMERYGVTEQTAYSDMRMVKELLPTLTESKRSYHRWRTNEMLMETYRRAKEQGDLRTMEKAASSYAKYNRVDQEDEKVVPYDQIVVQPFVPTMDPRVLGIEPVPNLDEKIRATLAKYTRECIDVEDVQFEEADLMENELFPEFPDFPTPEEP